MILNNEIVEQATFEDRVSYSIDLLRKTEKLALRLSPKGFFLAFSGGKDSQCLYHIAKMAGVKFEAHYQLTTLDPPELVYFIRENYPDVIVDLPKRTFLQLCEDKCLLPVRQKRFCCAELKECSGEGTVTLIGVRRAESTKRAKRNEVELNGRKFSGSLDQFNRDTEIQDQCMARFGKKDKVMVLPILHWTDKDVWRFLRENHIKYCKLYDEGWKRIGCLFCPMSKKSEINMAKKRYPKYAAAIIRTIHKIRNRENGGGTWMTIPNLTDEQVFEWWTSKKSIKKWYAENYQQIRMDI